MTAGSLGPCCCASRASFAARSTRSASPAGRSPAVRDQLASGHHRLRARRAGARLRARHVRAPRTARSGRPDRADARDRPPAHRPVDHAPTATRSCVGAQEADRLAHRAPRRGSSPTSATAIEARIERSRSCWATPSDPPAPRVAPHVRLPEAPPQLPPVLRRPAHVRRGHLDAEHRARLGRRPARAPPARARRRRFSRSAASGRSRCSASSPA